MPLPIIKGTTVPLEQNFTEIWSPSQGVTRSLTWKSFNRLKIQAYADYYALAGCSYHLDVQHGIATLTATDNTGNFTIDVWEIGVNENLVSSLKNPLNLAFIPLDNLTVIARAIKDGSTLGDAVTALVSDGLITNGEFSSSNFQFTGTADQQAASQRLYNRILQGSDSFFYYEYVLRHTTNVSNRYNINVSDVGVGQIYTQAELISEVTNANFWIFPMPGRMVYKLNQIPVPGVVSNYLWGWLKGASRETTAANDRINIETEYKLFQWSTDEYVAH